MILGTLFNVLTVVVGSVIGLLIRNRLPKRFIEIVFQAMGLFTFFLGISMALKTDNQFLLMVFSLVIGAILGEGFRLEERFNNASERLKNKIQSNNNSDGKDIVNNEKFTEGLVTAFLLFCIGPMAILGSIEEGLGQSSELLFTKSVMDGFSSVALAAGMGIGVLLSVVPLFLFQGGITILSTWIAQFLDEAVVNELSAVGGILLIGLALNILEIKKIKVLNLLPSLIVIVVLFSLFGK